MQQWNLLMMIYTTTRWCFFGVPWSIVLNKQKYRQDAIKNQAMSRDFLEMMDNKTSSQIDQSVGLNSSKLLKEKTDDDEDLAGLSWLVRCLPLKLQSR